ncbi:hypothetical protein FOA52_003046 [Chlamydomonas sp. UWO 241]|nr:hypothetical protein FOA52_003046 [Chlamydomonas sp. UWO 241]
MTKCQDIVVLEVAPLVSWTSYMVFASVASKPQMMAAMSRVEKLAQSDFSRGSYNKAGSSPWECLDFGDTIVHIMSEDQRDFYDVESFYATAEEVTLPFESQAPIDSPMSPQWSREEPQQ